MFKKTQNEKTKLDEAIDDVLREMAGLNCEDKDYNSASDQLVKLMKLKKEIEPSRRVSPDTLALVASNIVGILLILNYERANIVTSKALSFVMKLK
jgi:hypothetical protein